MSEYPVLLNITPDSRLAASLAWEPKAAKSIPVIYLIHCEGRIKVGIASSLAHRIGNIQSSCPFQIDLLASYTPDDPKADERMLHLMLEAHWVRGEWFHPPRQVIRVTIDLISSFAGSTVTKAGRRF